MHVDHQMVFRALNLLEQIEEAQRRARSLAGLRKVATRKENHVRERGMMRDELRILRRDQPVNSRTRITRTQRYQHWNRMHQFAERGRFEQQNARALGGL